MPDRQKAINFVNSIRFDAALLNSFNVPQAAQSRKTVDMIKGIMVSLCAEDQGLANSSRQGLRDLLLEALPNQFNGPRDPALGALDKDIATKAAQHIHAIIQSEKISFEAEPGDLAPGTAPLVIPRALAKHQKLLRQKTESGEYEIAREVALLIRREMAKQGLCTADTSLKHFYTAAGTRMPPRGAAPEVPDFDDSFLQDDAPAQMNSFDAKNPVPNLHAYAPLVRKMRTASASQNQNEVLKIADLLLKAMKKKRECLPTAKVTDVMFAADVTLTPFPDVRGGAPAPTDTATPNDRVDVETARKADLGNFGDIHNVPRSERDTLAEIALDIGRKGIVSSSSLKSAEKLQKRLQNNGRKAFKNAKHLSGAMHHFLTLTKSGQRKIQKPIKLSDLSEDTDL